MICFKRILANLKELFKKTSSSVLSGLKSRGEATATFRFRESKSGDEEKEFLKKSVSKSTRYETKWSFNIFAQWAKSKF